MDELLQQVVTILRSMWKHHWLGLAVAWLVAILGAGVVLRVPDKYEASARIYVDTQSILKPLMSGLTVQPNVDQQVMMLSRTLISRPNVEKLVRMADLDLGLQSKAQQDQLIDGLMGSLEIKSVGRDNLYTLAFRDPNPGRAQRVVQSLVSIFVESSMGDSRKDSDSAKKFLNEQIKAYEKKLEEAEGRLKDFKLKNLELQIGDGRSTTDRFGDLTNELQKARLALREAEQSRDALRRQITGEDPTLLPESGAGDFGVSIPEIDGRIDAQKRNLDSLLQRYTEEHPDVKGTRRLIKDLEEQKRTEIAARRKAAAANPSISVNSNPVYQQLKISLGEAEANVASLRTRVAEYEARYTRAKNLLTTNPQIEAEYAQLNRDYSIHKKNYEDLVARRESASLSGELESVAGVADFRLIDPPRVAPKPVAPNRLVLLPMVLLGSLALGLGACFVTSQLRPVFMDARTLREVTGLPLLGTVSLLQGHSVRIRESASFKRFVVGLVTLIAAFGVGIVILAVMGGKGS